MDWRSNIHLYAENKRSSLAIKAQADESEGLERNILYKWKPKKTEYILTSEKMNFKWKL